MDFAVLFWVLFSIRPVKKRGVVPGRQDRLSALKSKRAPVGADKQICVICGVLGESFVKELWLA